MGDRVVVEDPGFPPIFDLLDHSGEVAITRDVSVESWLPGQVPHIRSFSKSHGPDLLIAALGGSTELIERTVARHIYRSGQMRLSEALVVHGGTLPPYDGIDRWLEVGDVLS